MATEQNSLGLFYGEGKENNLQDEMERIRKKVERMRNKHSKEKPNLEYKGRLGGFVIVPDEVTFSGENLTHAEFRLWTVLRKHCREHKDGTREPAFPGRERLAIMMGKKSLARISELIRNLEKKGIIEVEHPYLHKTNRYTVKDPPRRWMNETRKRIKKIAEEENSDFPGK